MQLKTVANTFTFFVNENSTRLHQLRTRETLLEFLQEGLHLARKSKHLSESQYQNYLREAESLSFQRLQAYVYNLALAGEGLKTLKVG